MLYENIALIYKEDVIHINTIVSRKQAVKAKLRWRRLYGPLFRRAKTVINFDKKYIENGTYRKNAGAAMC